MMMGQGAGVPRYAAAREIIGRIFSPGIGGRDSGACREVLSRMHRRKCIQQQITREK